ncbi:MAG TPA: hypothetical protein VF752_04375 [Thermoleophilaceae bacterium]
MKTTLLAALAALALAANAQADSPASVTATLTDEGAAANGIHTLRVDVAATCPAGTNPWVQADLKGHWKNEVKPPFDPDPRDIDALGADDSVQAASASFKYRLPGGFIASAIGSVQCLDSEGNMTASADSAPTASIRLPVRLAKWESAGTTATFKRASCRVPSRGMQVGAGYDIKWELEADLRGAFGSGAFDIRVADLKQITLHISGGGRRALKFRSSSSGFKHFNGALVNGFYYQPRKAKPVKLWVTVNAVDSNVIAVKVKPKPRGC